MIPNSRAKSHYDEEVEQILDERCIITWGSLGVNDSPILLFLDRSYGVCFSLNGNTENFKILRAQE